MKKYPLILLLFSVINLDSAFERLNVGSRASALSGAYTSVCSDVYSIYYNPAGLALLPRMELAAQYARPFLNLTDGSVISQFFFAYALPTKFGTFSFAPLLFNANNIYNELTLLFSYAKRIKSFSFGLTPKIISLNYSADNINNAIITNEAHGPYGKYSGQKDPLFKDVTSKTAISLDLGLQYLLGTNYKFGFSIIDILSPNVSLSNNPQVIVPPKFNFGISHLSAVHCFNFEAKLNKYNSKQIDWIVASSYERTIASIIALRIGLSYGSRNNFSISCGLGYTTDVLSLDYATTLPLNGMRNTLGTHQISASFKFGPVIHVPFEAKELQEKLVKAETDLKETQIKLKTTEEKAKVLEEKLTVANLENEKARKEIERLKKELEKLLAAPPPAPPVVPPPVVPPPPPAPPAPPVVAPPAPDIEALKIEYVSSLEFYKRLEREKKTFKELFFTIDKIIKKFRGKGIDISEAESIYSKLSAEREIYIKEYRDSLKYYEKLVATGIGKEEREEILKRIIAKYKDKIDVKEAEDEMKKLK